MSINFSAGTVLDGKFEILSLIGQGGLGSVYKARQLAFDRIVAIKFLHTTLSDEENQERFKREGLALSSMKHKNIPTFYHFGLWREQVPYIAMQYLSGSTLRKEMVSCHQIPWRRAVGVTRQICDAMQHAHSQGIIHRDLKPENLVLETKDLECQVKVCDFGLAKICGIDSVKTLTESGLLIGSAPYMSPEQCEGKKADIRSDIYSLGCILFEMLTGKQPFQADNPIGVIHKHLSDPIPALPTGLDLPAGLEFVIRKAMAKNPSDRYQTMDEVQNDFLLLESGAGDDLLRKFTASGKPKTEMKIVAVFLGLLLLAGSMLISSHQKRQLRQGVSNEATTTKRASLKRLAGPTEKERTEHFLALFYKSDFRAARAIQLKQREFYRKNNRTREELDSLIWLARCDSQSGKIKEALAELSYAVQHCQSNDHKTIAAAMDELGKIHYELWCQNGDTKELREAARSYDAKYSSLQKLDDPSASLAALDLAKCKMWLGEHSNARAILSAAFADLKDSETTELEQLQRHEQQVRAIAFGKQNNTHSELLQDKVQALYSKDSDLLARYHSLMANCYILEQNLASAIQEFRRSIQECEKTSVARSMTSLHVSRIERILLSDFVSVANTKSRLEFARKARVLLLKATDASNADILVAFSFWICGDFTKAGDKKSVKELTQTCAKQLDGFRKHGSSEDLADLYRITGQIAIHCNPQFAEKMFKQSEQFCSGSDRSSQFTRMKALQLEGVLYFINGRYADCVAAATEASNLYIKNEFEPPDSLLESCGYRLAALEQLAVTALDKHNSLQSADYLNEIEECLKTTKRIDMTQIKNSVDPFIIRTIEVLKSINNRQKAPTLLHLIYERICEIQKSGVMKNEQCKVFVGALQELSTKFQNEKDLAYADELINCAIGFLNQTKIDDGSLVVDLYQKSACLKWKLGQNSKAKESFERAFEVAASNASIPPALDATLLSNCQEFQASRGESFKPVGRRDFQAACAVHTLSELTVVVQPLNFVPWTSGVDELEQSHWARKEMIILLEQIKKYLKEKHADSKVNPRRVVELLVLAKRLKMEDTCESILSALKKLIPTPNTQYHERISRRLRDAGYAHYEFGEFDKAEYFFRQGLDVYKIFPVGSDSAWEAHETLGKLAACLEKQGKYEAALGFRQQAVALLEMYKARQESHAAEARQLMEIARMYVEQFKNPAKSTELLEKAQRQINESTQKEQTELLNQMKVLKLKVQTKG